VHLVLGVAMTALGLVLFTGAAWARWTASVLVVLNLVAQFVSLPITPWWSLAVIVLDVVVLWALIVHGEEVERAVS
jgi:general stress protein CsbA